MHSVKIKERCVYCQLIVLSARSSSDRYLNYQVIQLSDLHVYVYCLQAIVSFKKSGTKDNLQYALLLDTWMQK
jgi:hypothetical protein